MYIQLQFVPDVLQLAREVLLLSFVILIDRIHQSLTLHQLLPQNKHVVSTRSTQTDISSSSRAREPFFTGREGSTPHLLLPPLPFLSPFPFLFSPCHLRPLTVGLQSLPFFPTSFVRFPVLLLPSPSFSYILSPPIPLEQTPRNPARGSGECY